MTDFVPMMAPWGVFMGLMWLLLVLLIGFGVVYFVLRLVEESRFRGASSERSADKRTSGSPREILDRRYAEGELSREEYEKKKEDISD